MSKIKDLKILFCCLSCNDQLYSGHIQAIKETWGKDIIDGKYGENVKLIFYDGWENAHTYDEENNILHVRCEDDLENTFKKTYYAFKLLQNKFDFDYIIRTNTSTYINVPLALKLIEHIEKNNERDILYCSDMMAVVESCVPNPLDIYGRGNFLVFSKNLINITLNEGFSFLYYGHCDDILIGNVLNSHWIKLGENYINHIKSVGHGWFRCIENFNGSNNHQLCEYSNENGSFEFMKNFISIQIKQYYHRSDEIENYKELHGNFNGNIDNDIENTLEKILKYSENYDIFIGSIIGYITLEQYKNINKQKLWTIGCNNKADNDPNKEIYFNKIWY